MPSTVATVVAFGAAGAITRLLLYPQFIIGMVFMTAGVLLKLSSAWVGVLLLLAAVVVLGIVVVYFNEHVVYAIRRVSPRVARFITRVSRLGVEKGIQLLSDLPPWVYTIVFMTLPSFARMSGTYSTARLLMFTKARKTAAPTATTVMVAGGVHQLARFVGLGKKPWARADNIHFMLQSLWVLYYFAIHSVSIDSPKGGTSQQTSSTRSEVFAILPSLLFGWGGLFLSFMPQEAVLTVLQAGASTAAVAGTAAAAAVTVSTQPEKLTRGKTKKVDRDLDDDGDEIEYELSLESATAIISKLWEDTKSSWTRWLRTFEEIDWMTIREGFQTKFESVKNFVTSTKSGNDVLEKELDSEKWDNVYEAAQKAGVLLKDFSPPMSVATCAFVVREFDSVIVLCLAAISGTIGVALGKVHVARLITLGLLTPFAVTQVLMFVTRFNDKMPNMLWKIPSMFWNQKSEDEEVQDVKYKDGMSLLLWDQPTLAGIWRKFADFEWDDAQELKQVVNAVVSDPKTALSKLVNETQEVPKLTRWILMKLLLSFAIDFMGILTYIIPGIGEVADAALAPLSAYFIHQLYGNATFSWLGFFEEILPFTDIIPTATLAWFYEYGSFVPVWWEQGEIADVMRLPSFSFKAPLPFTFGKTRRKKSSSDASEAHFKLE